MDIAAIREKVKDWVEEKLRTQSEYFLVDIKVQGRKLSVFLDGDNGININKCAEFSRYLERHLDGEMIIGGNYILEVSSPGTDNPFKVARQYRKAIGKEVSVVKFDGIREDGVLKEADEIRMILETTVQVKGKQAETKIQEIPFNQIKSTKLNFNF